MGWKLAVLPQKSQSLVNQHSEQPTPECAFILEVRRIARRSPPAVVYGEINAGKTTEHAESYEVQQPVTPPKSYVEFRCLFLVISQDEIVPLLHLSR